MSHKVFISHASEDKDRFVLQFAARLRKIGIDAWLDKWEMLPGDSLVNKIFNEGIKEAKAVIVVLSKFSVGKPWVQEELNAAFVKRINSGSRLIPVILDDCEVPEALKSTVWEPIADISAYDPSFENIVASIYGINEKPPLGPQPEYVKSLVHNIDGLSSIDGLILWHSCEEALKTGNGLVDAKKLFIKENKPLVPNDELNDSLEILDSHGYIKLIRRINSFGAYWITTHGFDVYAKNAVEGYQDKIVSVVSAIVNEGLNTNIKIQDRLKESQFMIDHIMDLLEINKYIEQVKYGDRFSRVMNVSPSLKRALRDGVNTE